MMVNERKVLLEEMTWEEIKEAIEHGIDTVLVIAGSIEQHGPHLPIVTDTVLGYEWGKAIALKMGNAVVAPVIRPGLSSHHLGFPGTVTLSNYVFQQILKSYIECLIKTGFRKIIIICSHGGNLQAVKQMLPLLQKKYINRALVDGVLDIEQKDKLVNDFLEANGYSAKEGGIHAGLTETSCMLALLPDLVRKERIRPGYIGPINDGVLHQKGLRAYTDNGVLGDPTRASEELGEAINQITVEFYYNEINRIISEKTNTT
jgi:creatinine amidohydrolase